MRKSNARLTEENSTFSLTEEILVRYKEPLE